MAIEMNRIPFAHLRFGVGDICNIILKMSFRFVEAELNNRRESQILEYFLFTAYGDIFRGEQIFVPNSAVNLGAISGIGVKMPCFQKGIRPLVK